MRSRRVLVMIALLAWLLSQHFVVVINAHAQSLHVKNIHSLNRHMATAKSISSQPSD
jgi:hypothetical protein